MGEAGPAALLDDLLAAFGRAADREGLIEHSYRLGGRRIAVRFAGPGLVEPLSAALAHRRADDAGCAADLTIHVFDSASTGTDPPPAPWGAPDVEAAGVVRRFTDDRFHSVFQVAVGLLTVLDRERGAAVCWLRDGATLPMPERAAPFRRLLQAWFRDHGALVCHAGAVGRDDGGVLLAGQEGAGKSTTALACLDSTSLRYAADDYCLIQTGDLPWVHSLYSSGKCHRHDQGRLRFLAPMEANPDRPDEKALYLLQPQMPDRLIGGFPLRAILVPRVGEAPSTTVGPVSAAMALQALAATTVLLAPQAAATTLGSLSALVRAVPHHELRLGGDTASTVRAIETVLEGAR